MEGEFQFGALAQEMPSYRWEIKKKLDVKKWWGWKKTAYLNPEKPNAFRPRLIRRIYFHFYSDTVHG